MTFDKVMKFGGAALADGPSVERVCAIVRDQGGDRPVVVVSAHQGVTDLLDAVARAASDGVVDGDRPRIRHRSLLRQLGLDAELLNRYFAELVSLLAEIARRRQLVPGERDLVLSYGERMSARIVAHALKRTDVPATPVDAFDLGLTTDSNHGAARPLPESRAAVRDALLQVPGVPVVTGFLAKDRHGNLTTLGRNGSDLTAALVAEAVGASALELWKAVGGMMTADPALVPEARVIESLSFEEAASFAGHGADVLHPDALAPARRAGVAVRFLDVRDPRAAGTVLGAVESGAGPIGIAARRRLVRVGLGSAQRADLADALARHGIEPAAWSERSQEVAAYFVPGPSAELLLADLRGRFSVEKDLALVALLGRAPEEVSLLESALEALARSGIQPIEAIEGPECASHLFIVRAADLERASRSLHAAFFASEGARVP